MGIAIVILLFIVWYAHNKIVRSLRSPMQLSPKERGDDDPDGGPGIDNVIIFTTNTNASLKKDLSEKKAA